MKHDGLEPLLRAVLDEYSLPWAGAHGIAHWARVLEIGIRLAGQTGADVEVVRLFALLHDSRRRNESTDPEHGPRAAAFAETIRGKLIDLPDDRFRLLHRACYGHTHERTHPDPTIQTCWDADRLDLGRVGITPSPLWLSSPTASDPEMIRWADGRACMNFLPQFVLDDWGIDLRGRRDQPTTR